MIAKVAKRGSHVAGLVHYVLGPGKGADGPERGDVHQDQRVVAMSSDITEVALRRGLSAGEESSLSVQLGLYAQMFPQACPQAGSVYHVVFSLPAGEHLEDDQWATIAEDTAKVLHLERPDGAVGSWAAFCHGESAGGFEHMHFAASLVRSDGSEVRPYLRNGYAELHGVARTAEARYGLSVLAGRDHGSVPTPQRPEVEACARRGRAEPERDRLARAVRSAATGAKTEMDFIDGLRAAEVLVRPRYETGGRTKVVGYSVAVPLARETPKETRVREAAGEPRAKPVWFGGGKLGRDLTLPALRARWGQQGEHAQAGEDPDTVRRWQRRPPLFDAAAERKAMARLVAGNKPWVRAGDALSKLNRLTAESGDLGGPEWRRLARDAAGATSGLSRRLEVDGPGPLAAASKALARAAQQPVGAPDVADDQRSRMRGVAAVCGQHHLAASGNHAEAWLRVVRELARLADTLQRLAAARSELRVEADLADAARTELRAAHAGLRAEWPAHLQTDEATAPYEAKGMSNTPRGGLTPGRSVENTGPSLPAPAPQLLSRLENLAGELPERAAREDERAAQARSEATRAAGRIGQPFEHTGRIESLRQRLTAIDEELTPTDPATAPAVAPEQPAGGPEVVVRSQPPDNRAASRGRPPLDPAVSLAPHDPSHSAGAVHQVPTTNTDRAGPIDMATFGDAATNAAYPNKVTGEGPAPSPRDHPEPPAEHHHNLPAEPSDELGG